MTPLVNITFRHCYKVVYIPAVCFVQYIKKKEKVLPDTCMQNFWYLSDAFDFVLLIIINQSPVTKGDLHIQ